MRLIDADEFMSYLITRYGGDDTGEEIIEDLTHQPTVDAVQVVRCKDCRWGREVCGNIECFVDSNMPSEYHGYEWFCPMGERRSE